MTIYKGRREGRWDFPILDEGEYNFEIADTVEIIERTTANGIKRTLRVPLIPEGQEKPGPSIFCPLDIAFGVSRLLDIIVTTGLAAVMQKEKKLPDIEKQGIDDTVIKSDKFLNYIVTKLPGYFIKCTIKHRTYEEKETKEKRVVPDIVAFTAATKTWKKEKGEAAAGEAESEW